MGGVQAGEGDLEGITVKKLISLMIITLLVLSLAACGIQSQNEAAQESSTNTNVLEPKAAQPKSNNPTSADETSPSEQSTSDQTAPVEPVSGNNILVIYFSRTGEQYNVGVIEKGNTAIVAEEIAEQTGADLFEVLPVDDHYPMTYSELTDVAKQEQKDKARPEYTGNLPELSQYDTIFIGAPVWWGDWPMIMYTVFENNDFSGKQLVPFSTHEGSGLSGFDKKLASAIPAATVLKGQAFRGGDCQNDLDSVRDTLTPWLSGLGF